MDDHGSARLALHPKVRFLPTRPLAAAALGLSALVLLARPAPARADDDEGRWSEGTWSGDEGSWENDGPRPGDPRDGYAWRSRDDEGDDDRGRFRGRDDDERGRWEHERYEPPQSGPSMVEFQESLSPYGEWIDTPEYGTVWRPTRIDDGWRPYYLGHWAWTVAGWYWVADEPFGWAVYHYGRWAYLDGVGWSWLPGQRWAPAWVAWRWGDGYAGWCPLGPRGYVYARPVEYVIVQQQFFLAPVPHHAVPVVAAASFFPLTRAMPVLAPGPHAGPVVHVVARATGREVRPLNIVDASSPPRGASGAVSGGAVFAYRPRVVPLGRPQAGAGAHASQGPAQVSPRWSAGARAAPAQPSPQWGARPASPQASPQSSARPASPQASPQWGARPAQFQGSPQPNARPVPPQASPQWNGGARPAAPRPSEGPRASPSAAQPIPAPRAEVERAPQVRPYVAGVPRTAPPPAARVAAGPPAAQQGPAFAAPTARAQVAR